jgi:hypothetical protein
MFIFSSQGVNEKTDEKRAGFITPANPAHHPLKHSGTLAAAVAKRKADIEGQAMEIWQEYNQTGSGLRDRGQSSWIT